MQRLLRLTACLAAMASAQVRAEAPPTAAAVSGRVSLPQDHAWQRVLRGFMATLREEDFAHGVTDRMAVVEAELDAEALHRLHIMTMMEQPAVGFKRGTPAVNSPAWLFLLSTIEGPETAPPRAELLRGFEPLRGSARICPGPIAAPTGIVVPPVWPDALVAFTQWDYPGNPFHDNRALKMRAFVTAAVRLIMLDHHFDDPAVVGRSDWNAYQLLTFSSTYRGIEELLPPEVRAAYLEGMRRFGDRILEWGIRGEEPNLDMTAPIALWYAASILADPEFSGRAEAYARRLMADPDHFHPAGYWVERGGGIDTGFGGMANFFAVWTALASDWPFATEAVDCAYRLRAHLSLPEPDGTLTGPSQFNSRLGTPANADQWDWDGARDLAALMVTDEAAPAARRPTAEQLETAAARRIDTYTRQLHGSLRNPYNPFRDAAGHYGYVRDEDLRGSTWRWRLWDSFNFPATLNPGVEFYRPGACARLKRLEREQPRVFDSPYARGETFLRGFEEVFFTTRQGSYAAILHTGPVGEQDPHDGLVRMPGPMGFGGGQLSAFWTPRTGCVILGRRAGMTPDRSHDDPEQWRQWPIHAVSGITADGMLLTTARIVAPTVAAELDETKAVGTVRVAGVIPPFLPDPARVSVGTLTYARGFTIEPGAVRVETTFVTDGQTRLTEAVETLPVYLRDAKRKPAAVPTVIEFREGDAWHPAGVEWTDHVKAVRLTRFDGAVEIDFDEPQRVRLSDTDWTDSFITRATCRNILIDLLEPAHSSGSAATRRVAYRIAPIEADRP
jgi:hypothetical protein